MFPSTLDGAMLTLVCFTVYFNSLLGMLNARDSLRNNLDGGILEIVSDHLPAASDAHYGSKSTDGPYTEEKRQVFDNRVSMSCSMHLLQGEVEVRGL